MATKNQTTVTAEPGKQELFITREFEAPRELVFKAFSDPEMIVRWLGPCKMTMRIEKMEPEGGAWRFIHADQQGNEFGFHGVTHESTAPERIIRTFEFEGLPEKGHVVLEKAQFDALPGGRTRLVVHNVFLSVADRDGMVMSGMESGVQESHTLLDELLEQELQKA